MTERERRIDEAIVAYLQEVEAGRVPDRSEFLARFIDVQEELIAFLTDRAAFQSRVGAVVRYFGDYELLDEIARGGMGVVYRARQTSLNRIVALKMILSGSLASAEDVARFKAEAESAANLDHPNIVPIYEVGDHEGQHYFSMKLLEGGSLASVLPQLQRDLRRAAALLARVARAVHFAHQRGILHRDLKPDNVLLDADGAPLVADFGLARRLTGGARTQTGAIPGTPAYMAPEQTRGERALSTAVDVWALGVILYQCLTGRLPFDAPDLFTLLPQIQDQDPPPPRSLNRTVDRDLEVICLKCLHKDPVRRYASAAELADDLERWLRREPIVARPVGTTERFWRWCQRNPAVAALTAAVFLTVLIGTVSSLTFAVEARSRAADALRKEADALFEAARAEEAERQTAKAKLDLERQLRLTREHLLTAQLRMVEPLYESDPARGLALLHDPIACPVEVRDPAWRYFERACRRWKGADFLGHTLGIYTLAFSPDGKTLASADRDREVRLWDVATEQVRATLGDHNGFVECVAFSADGSLLAAGGGGLNEDKFPGSVPGEVRLWEVGRREVRVVLTGNAATVNAVVFSPDGQTLASGAGGWSFRDGSTMPGELKLWDVTTGKERTALTAPNGPVRTLGFCPDNQTLICGAQGQPGELQMWHAGTGQVRANLPGHSAPVWSLSLSADGRLLASSSADSVKLWDLSSPQSTGRELP